MPLTYVEPFAGGAGIALRLLYDEQVDDVVLNDLDPGVAAFWRAVFSETANLVDLILGSDVSVEEWHRQRSIYDSKTGTDLELGFATFFLNRTNRSGIIGARPIGGLDQKGKWGISARFNAVNLAERVRLAARYRYRVHVREDEGSDVVRDYVGQPRTFLYVDPPYLTKADGLYLNSMEWADHELLAACLRDSGSWVITYDEDDRVPQTLYPGLRCAEFGIKHTAAVQHIGREYAVFSRELSIPDLDLLGHGAHLIA
jgi:DNA adenine methylase